MKQQSEDQVPGFSGFGPGMTRFFAELAENQSREWFQANRDRFEREIGIPLAHLVTSVTLALAARDIPLIGTPKTSIFRMNRDIRFSKDKRPYRTNAGAVLSRTGTRHSQGVLYIHVEPDRSFLALGFYAPEPDALAALRDAIVVHPERWRAAIEQLAGAGLAISRDQLTPRMPRGYDATALGDLADWLRLKSFVVRRGLAPPEISHPQLIDAIVDFAIAGLPLLRFGWDALASVAPRSV